MLQHFQEISKLIKYSVDHLLVWSTQCPVVHSPTHPSVVLGTGQGAVYTHKLQALVSLWLRN